MEKKLRDGLASAEAKGWTRPKIAAACGLKTGVIQKFMQHPERGINVSSADRIMRFLSMTCSSPIVPDLPADEAELRRFDLQKFGEGLASAVETVSEWDENEINVPANWASKLANDEEALLLLAKHVMRNLESED